MDRVLVACLASSVSACMSPADEPVEASGLRGTIVFETEHCPPMPVGW